MLRSQFASTAIEYRPDVEYSSANARVSGEFSGDAFDSILPPGKQLCGLRIRCVAGNNIQDLRRYSQPESRD
jgi:hypothetical protein